MSRAFEGKVRQTTLRVARRAMLQGRSIVNLGIGSPDFRTPQNIVEAGKKAIDDGFHFYTPAKGLNRF